MINVYILEANNNYNTKLQKFGNSYEFYKFPKMLNKDFYKSVNIYITNNEEIKKGDWYYNLALNSVEKTTEFDNGLLQEKIILTTDQYLIKDGVQAINDEFLEWFVENPSCENVDVETIEKMIGSFGRGKKPIYIDEYKIIIPKEEPKQETIEEVAERFLKYGAQDCKTAKQTLIEFYKYQQQQQNKNLYSDEEVLDILSLRLKYFGIQPNEIIDRKWFEQFKKKH